LILSTIIFTISIAGIFLNRKNILVLLMSLELMFLSVNFNLITLGNYLGDLTGQVFVFFVLTVVAAESAIGLALLIVLFRSKKSIDVDDLSELKG
jgi:NADH-quinone oxidoreductase subunit K